MSPNQIVEHLRQRPFQPLRIYVSDGSSYEVFHPEMVVVSRIQVAIAFESPNGGLPERMVYCDPLHITRIEPIKGKRRKPTPLG